MPRYLVQGSYTAEGAKGLLKDRGSKPRVAVETMAKSAGGKVETFYFGFGEKISLFLMFVADAVLCSLSASTGGPCDHGRVIQEARMGILERLSNQQTAGGSAQPTAESASQDQRRGFHGITGLWDVKDYN